MMSKGGNRDHGHNHPIYQLCLWHEKGGKEAKGKPGIWQAQGQDCLRKSQTHEHIQVCALHTRACCHFSGGQLSAGPKTLLTKILF